MDKIINGLEMAQQLRSEIRDEVKDLARSPKLAVILVGENQASQTYVRNKKRVGDEVGIDVDVIELAYKTEEEAVVNLIDQLNEDHSIDGILVQLPLPDHISENRVINRVSVKKDVDGFTQLSNGLLMQGLEGFHPCTPEGIMYMLEKIDFEFEGKNAVVIGRSNIVGLPTAKLLLDRNMTVTITHSRTKDLGSICKQADLLVVAIGKPEFVDKTFVKEGAVVIDVGINRDENNKLVGDVNFDDVLNQVSRITPVPKGVGPMTVAMLMKNTLSAYKRKGD